MAKGKKRSKVKRTNLDLILPYIKDYSFIFDFSIVVINEIYELFEQIVEHSGKIIILTSTLDELKKCEEMSFIPSSYNSKRILNMASIYNYCFTIENNDDNSFLSSDEKLLRYCSKNKRKIAYITYSKKMYISSVKNGVLTILLNNSPLIGEIRTLRDAKLYNNSLFITNIELPFKMIHTFSGNIEISNGNCSLNIGDDVFVVVKKMGYMVFIHFRIISLKEEANCVIKYHRRITSLHDINKLPNGNYRYFVRNFVQLTDD